MIKKIFLVTLPLIIIIVILFVVFFNSPEDKSIGPVLVPLYKHPQQISFRGLHATDDSVVVVGGSDGVLASLQMQENNGYSRLCHKPLNANSVLSGHIMIVLLLR